MIIDIDILTRNIEQFLYRTGLSKVQVTPITANIVAAELAGKKTHGIARLPLIAKWVAENKIKRSASPPCIEKAEKDSLFINGKGNSGYLVLSYAIMEAQKAMKNKNIMLVSMTNTGPSVGYFAQYARIASQNGFVFIGFSNTDGGLAPFGSSQGIWGHNPIALGIPFNEQPVVFDFGCGVESWGEMQLKDTIGKSLVTKEYFFDSLGRKTVRPFDVMNGGAISAFGGAKGSALAFWVEIIAGIFSSSRAGRNIEGGWGTTFILVNPYTFVDKIIFEDKLGSFISEVKQARSIDQVRKIFYPGEKSSKKYLASLNQGSIRMNKIVYSKIFKSI